MQATMKMIKEPADDVHEQTVEVSRLPVLGEYLRSGSEWYQVKRVAHLTNHQDVAGELYVVPIVDPTRDPLTLYEWLEPAP